jgi:hypothetical protein
MGLNPVFSLLLVNSLAGLLLLYSFRQLASQDLDAEGAQTSVLLLLFSPLAMTLFIPYTEPLYLLWAVLCLLWARKSRWWLAGIAAGLATLTRQQGLFLVIPLAWELWEASGKNMRQAIQKYRDWLALLLTPISMGGWLLYRGLALNDVRLNIAHPLDFIYSTLLSHTSNQVVPGIQFLPPWQVIGLAVQKLITTPDIDLWTNVIFGLAFMVGLILSWPRLRTSYRLFSLAIVLVALSFYTGPTHPYMGLPRHLWLAFPIFIGLATIFNRPWKRLVGAILGTLSMQFLLLQYVLESWVP